jgi:hypothetical protein
VVLDNEACEQEESGAGSSTARPQRAPTSDRVLQAAHQPAAPDGMHARAPGRYFAAATAAQQLKLAAGLQIGPGARGRSEALGSIN